MLPYNVVVFEVVLIMSKLSFYLSEGNSGKAQWKYTCQLQHKNNRECIKIASIHSIRYS